MDNSQDDSRYMPAVLKAAEEFSVAPKDIELVAHSENVTFRITVPDSDHDYVLRLHRPGYNSIEELNSEREWTKALNEAGISAPESVLTRDGDYFTLIDIPGSNEQRYAGMTFWIDGTPLGDYLETASGKNERTRIFARIGELAAATHNQATSWKEPPGFTRPRLDVEGLLGEAPRWGRFWEHSELTDDERSLLLRTRDQLGARLNAYGTTPENFTLIHADINPDNIVYDGRDLALIDFDDAAYGWHMYDLASALINECWAKDINAVIAATLDGYRRRRALKSRDIDMLQAFLLIRGMATIGWFHQRPEYAGSDFFEELKKWVLDECNANDW
ncbi:MAG: phosphotransferase [Gammaproteobacteria bacterium]|nr:phosphotransferase [Gammaproteobacteria bacterium]